MFGDDGAGGKTGLGGGGIGTDQTAGSKEGAAEIAGDHYCCVAESFPKQHVEHWPSGSSAGFSVIAGTVSASFQNVRCISFIANIFLYIFCAKRMSE